MYRIGHGFDVHPFVENRKLIICGVNLDYPLGLKGHSDADVAIHALIDSIFGALALGDIGKHFPDSDAQYKDIDSGNLLKKTAALMRTHNYDIHNLDITIHAEEPKMAGHINQMREKIASLLNCDMNLVSIKATTWEKLGFIGKKHGIAADAVLMLKKIDNTSTERSKKKRTDTESTQLFDDNIDVTHRVKTKGQMEIYVDGASRGNPGPSGAGGIIRDPDGKIIREISEFLGKKTNNQAEYQALILTLKEAVALRPESLVIYMDSELVVKQIQGKYQVKNAGLISLNTIVKQQLMSIVSWEIRHVKREDNAVADRLANKAIDDKFL